MCHTAYVHSNKNLRPKQVSSLIHFVVFKDFSSKFVESLISKWYFISTEISSKDMPKINN